MAKQLRDKLITFTVYANGSEEFGSAEVSLPDLEFITSTIKGGGLAGELEVPTLGQLKSMKATITWQIVEKSLSKFARQRYHQVEFRGAQQTENTETGDLQVSAVSVQVGGWVTKTSMGKLANTETTGSTTDISINAIKAVVDGEELYNIDIMNGVCVIDGVDYWADIRKALGK